MEYLPVVPNLSRIGYHVLVDLRRMANALASRFIPELLAIYIAKQHRAISAEEILMELCRQGYLRFLSAQERYVFSDKKPSPPPKHPNDSVRVFLNDSFFETIATKLREGSESIESLVRESDTEDEGDKPLTLERVEEALFAPRYAVNGSRTPATRWDVVAADHLYLEQMQGSALSLAMNLRLLSHHYQHLVNPTARRNALRSAGILAPIFPHGKHHNRWTVTDMAREVLKKREVLPSLTADEAKELLSPKQSQ